MIDGLSAADWLWKDGEEPSSWKDDERDCLAKGDRSRKRC